MREYFAQFSGEDMDKPVHLTWVYLVPCEKCGKESKEHLLYDDRVVCQECYDELTYQDYLSMRKG